MHVFGQTGRKLYLRQYLKLNKKPITFQNEKKKKKKYFKIK